MTYFIWSCLKNNKDFSIYRSKFKKIFYDLIENFFNVEWDKKQPVYEHIFFNYMYLAQLFIPDDCVLRKSLDSAVSEFTKKWITSKAPVYLETKEGKKILKLERV